MLEPNFEKADGLGIRLRKLFKGGNYSREETIDFLFSTSTQNN